MRGFSRRSVPVDRDRLREVTSGDLELQKELIELYLESGAGLIRSIGSAVISGDMDALRRGAHTLKGSSANLGAVGIFDCARRLERDGRKGNLRAAESRLSHLRGEWKRVLSFFGN